MGGAIPSLPDYVFMAWCLVKQGDNFTFYFSEMRCVNTVSYRISCYVTCVIDTEALNKQARNGTERLLCAQPSEWKNKVC
jgi:hypothetical protein